MEERRIPSERLIEGQWSFLQNRTEHTGSRLDIRHLALTLTCRNCWFFLNTVQIPILYGLILYSFTVIHQNDIATGDGDVLKQLTLMSHYRVRWRTQRNLHRPDSREAEWKRQRILHAPFNFDNRNIVEGILSRLHPGQAHSMTMRRVSIFLHTRLWTKNFFKNEHIPNLQVQFASRLRQWWR